LLRVLMLMMRPIFADWLQGAHFLPLFDSVQHMIHLTANEKAAEQKQRVDGSLRVQSNEIAV